MWVRKIIASLLLKVLWMGPTPLLMCDGFVIGAQSPATTRHGRTIAATILPPNDRPHLLGLLPRDRSTTVACSATTRRDFVTLGALNVVAALSGLVLAPPPSAVAKGLGEDYRQGTAALAETEESAPVPRDAYQKLDSGVIYADLRKGNGGTVVRAGSRLNLQWVLRKSNGYFVDSSERNGSVPFIFTVGDGTAIVGLDEAVRGMQEGGVRRVLIPPSLAYVDGLDDGKPGPLPTGYGPRQQMRRVQNIRKDVPGEYVFLEVQATRVR